MREMSHWGVASTPATSLPRLAPHYIIFEREQWAALRTLTPVALSEADLPALAGVNQVLR